MLSYCHNWDLIKKLSSLNYARKLLVRRLPSGIFSWRRKIPFNNLTIREISYITTTIFRSEEEEEKVYLIIA